MDSDNISEKLPIHNSFNNNSVLQDAKRDDVSRRAYKLLATLHSDCSELVKMVEETGANVRESRDLEDQVIIHPKCFSFSFFLASRNI